ncbi:lipoprotein NlpD [Bisgaardia hudsonensis]|uniref:Lipoprotein NlpD n=1 Tax=Bisgaardia hudsonensis TaxID=109472 RepID=A0A4R2N258_9PAST|nr:peptidoglycan DD-metalloendopeptidase family protein [Bisgaardia hudsonensis]QLB12396.1 peptidase M23 [Bisgaardia hudsonensis]TCP13923.1 lipoprotein NlpD [Bisgaardia hudsonensis]
MKKFLVLPIAITVLTACSSNAPAPVENASGELTPGVMQPVSNTGTNGSWQPQIVEQSIPVNNNTNIGYQQGVNTQVNATKQKVNTQINATKQKINTQVNTVTQKVSQDFTIPRNPQTNAPEYSKIDKGFYKGSSYKVRKGDTMFLIAYISGISVDELATANNMSEPYHLAVGQTLTIPNNSNEPTNIVAPSPKIVEPVKPVVTYREGPNGTKYGSDGTIVGPIKSTTANAQQTVTDTTIATVQKTPSIIPIQTTKPVVASNIAWRWPTNGTVIQGFSSADGGNKGIDIKGSRGQAVNATSAGRVVYAGNALRGYGNLIIIKHNNDYLSAYAHNETILVKDQQEVSTGQQIAKMGSSGTNAVKLHFEIRYKGKSVDPMSYLPRR